MPPNPPVAVPPNPDTDPNQRVSDELVALQGQVEATRAVLVRLLQDVVEVEARLANDPAMLLLEANEQLVVSAMRSQADAETAHQTLAEVAHAAELDHLTQLPNRLLLRDRFGRAIGQARRHGTQLALLFVDLDDFKQINDLRGHAVGDQVLKLVAQRLTDAVRAVDTVSRHGGDEFLILLSEVSRRADAGLIADKVLAALAAPFRLGDQDILLSASIGISLYPGDGDEVDRLIDRADAAMYRAKRHAPGSITFHGDAPAGEPHPAGSAAPSAVATAAAAAQATLQPGEPAHCERDRHQAELREANERLVLAALSARQMHEAAERALERQDHFMGLVAKELSDPLAPIRLATTMLGRAQSSEPLMPRVEAIIDQHVRQVGRLVDAVGQLSRAGRTTPSPDQPAADMVTVVAAEADIWRPLMATRRQRLSVQACAGPCPVRGEPGALAQIVGNLLDNASKYTPEHGEIRLTTAVDGRSLQITVADNGIGISPQALHEVFEPFVQDILGLGYNGVGPGIGLTVVRERVEALGGRVVAHSAGRGQGSRFVVTLPLADDGDAAGGARE